MGGGGRGLKGLVCACGILLKELGMAPYQS